MKNQQSRGKDDSFQDPESTTENVLVIGHVSNKMVLAALCEQFLPSDRGLSRNHENLAAANDGRLWEQHHYYNQWRAKQDNSVYGRNSIVISNQSGDDGNGNELIRTPDQVMPPVAPSTRPRRRRFMASKFLASAAADFDVITDWAFYFHCQGENADHYETEGVYLIPPHLVYLVLATCVIGTSMWLVLATDGKIAAPLLRFFGYDRLNLGHVLLACVVVEDLSQVVLTFWIEDYYEGEGDINSYALVNVVASFYDILIKLAEAYDQRADGRCRQVVFLLTVKPLNHLSLTFFSPAALWLDTTIIQCSRRNRTLVQGKNYGARSEGNLFGCDS